VDVFIASAASAQAGDPATVARVLVRSGDAASARRLIPFDGMNRSRLAGLVAAHTPGSESVAGALQLHGPEPASRSELAIGLAAGLAMRGRMKEAAAVADALHFPPDQTAAHSIILSYQPTKANLDQFLKRFRVEQLWGDDLKRVARVAVMAGDPALAQKMIDEAVRRSTTTDFPDEVRDAVMNAHLRAGNLKAANTLAETVTDVSLQQRIQTRRAREPARRADVKSVRQVAEAATIGNAKRDMDDLRVYAEARSGNAEAAQRLCDESASAKADQDRRFAVRYGMLAAAHREAGRDAEAAAAIGRAVTLIDGLPDATAKAIASRNLIVAAVLGVDYYSYNYGFTDLW
jgi:hypothetical protein